MPDLWPFPVRQPVTEVLEWNTDTLITEAAEQRIALRTVPRSILTVSHLLNASDLARAAELARAGIGRYMDGAALASCAPGDGADRCRRPDCVRRYERGSLRSTGTGRHRSRRRGGISRRGQRGPAGPAGAGRACGREPCASDCGPGGHRDPDATPRDRPAPPGAGNGHGDLHPARRDRSVRQQLSRPTSGSMC